MSAVTETTARDARVAAILEAHGGDADAALLTCLLEIDRLAAALDRVSYQTSRGYSYGFTRRTTRPASVAVAPSQEPLDV